VADQYRVLYSLLVNLMLDNLRVVLDAGLTRTAWVAREFNRGAIFEMDGLESPN
jgi:hypothetical protein